MNRREFLNYVCKGALVLALGLPMVGCEKRKRGLSDILYEDAIIHKQYIPEDDQLATGIALGHGIKNIAAGIAIGTAMSKDEQYKISIRGKRVNFDINNKELFDKFEEGEMAKVGYMEIYQSTYDKESLVEKKLVGYGFVSLERNN